MATDLVVPALGESVTEATVAQWLKQPGDAVAVDEPIVELETDKVTLEVNASVAGVLLEVIAAAGATVEVGALPGRIGDGAGPPAKKPEPKKPEPEKPTPEEAEANPGTPQPTDPTRRGTSGEKMGQ